MLEPIKNKLLLFSASLLLAMTISSCEEEKDESKPEYSTATIKGHVTAPLDDTASGMEDVTSTTITFWISTEDLVTQSSGKKTYDKRYYHAEVDAEGKYSVKIDVNNQPVDVTIEPNDFAVDDYVNPSGDEERRAYSPVTPSQTVTVTPKATKVVDIVYN